MERGAVYTRSAQIYDAINSARREVPAIAQQVDEIVRCHKRSSGNRLLDVACGTGLYLPEFRRSYEVEGLDLSPAMLAIARQRCPDVPLHKADLADFDLGRRFDVLTCLFSSIGYVRSVDRLRQALRAFARHLEPGGVAIVEPWFEPQDWEDGRIVAEVHEQPGMKIARASVSGLSGRIATMDVHYLVATREGVDHFSERHELGLFTRDEYLGAFHDAGFSVMRDPVGFAGRGVYVGVRH
jgi:ubiquinone/menaquinone biosynthesis C-methylase UbiE